MSTPVVSFDEASSTYFGDAKHIRVVTPKLTGQVINLTGEALAVEGGGKTLYWAASYKSPSATSLDDAEQREPLRKFPRPNGVEIQADPKYALISKDMAMGLDSLGIKSWKSGSWNLLYLESAVCGERLYRYNGIFVMSCGPSDLMTIRLPTVKERQELEYSDEMSFP